MPPIQGNALIDSYVVWLRDQITTQELDDGAIEITTPFLDRHRDHIQIFVESKQDRLLLSDDSYTISDLRLSGCSLDSEHRKKILNVILNGYGITRINDELTIDSNIATFPEKKHALIQGMLAVNDMFLTAKQRVETLFLEDVAAFLDANEVRYSPEVRFTGKSGLQQRFDFVIPKSKNSPERLIRAINNPTLEAAQLALFAWTDTRDARSTESKLFMILNDLERSLKANVTSAMSHYDVTVIPWTKRDQFVTDLVA
jgi:uncharacterized protein DUF1829/uncharacterized protein DUF1828